MLHLLVRWSWYTCGEGEANDCRVVQRQPFLHRVLFYTQAIRYLQYVLYVYNALLVNIIIVLSEKCSEMSATLRSWFCGP